MVEKQLKVGKKQSPITQAEALTQGKAVNYTVGAQRKVDSRNVMYKEKSHYQSLKIIIQMCQVVLEL